jgi:hypothetical protein
MHDFEIVQIVNVLLTYDLRKFSVRDVNISWTTLFASYVKVMCVSNYSQNKTYFFLQISYTPIIIYTPALAFGQGSFQLHIFLTD